MSIIRSVVPKRPLATSNGSPRLVAAMLAVFTITCAVLVGTAGSASAQTPAWPPWLNTADSNLVCETDVAGITPGGDNEHVLWTEDAGFSVQIACLGTVDISKSGYEIGEIGILVGQDFFQGWPQSEVFTNEGSTTGANGYVYALARADGGNGDVQDDGGFDPCTVLPSSYTPQPQCLVQPLLQEYQRTTTSVRFRARFDFLPQINDSSTNNHCLSGGYWCQPKTTANGQPTTNLAPIHASRAPVGVNAVLVDDNGDSEGSFSNYGHLSHQDYDDFVDEYDPNDSGAAEPTDYPSVHPPGAEDPADGSCKLTGWTLTDTTDDRQWTDDSPDTFAITLTDGHVFELTVRFTGSPPSIRMQLRRDAEPIATDQAFNPTSPHTFDPITGDGERVQLSVTCYSSDGDIGEDAQIVITDETEDPRSTLSECLGEAEFTLTSPGSWIRYGINGVGCILSWAFVPDRPLEERFYEIRSSSDSATKVSGAIASVNTGLSAVSSTGASNCAGPTITIDSWNGNPLSVCDGWMAGAATTARVIALGGIVLMTFGKLWEIFMGAIYGEKTKVYQAEFNTPTNNGTWE